MTELLCDLGLEERLVGVTKFCVHPPHLRKQKTVVGGTKTLHIDKVKELNPDFVIANKEENTQQMIEAIEQICPVYVTDIKNPADIYSAITDLSHLFELVTKGKEIIDQLTIAIPNQLFNNKKVAYLIWKSPYMTVGGDTYISNLLTTLGLNNAFGNQVRYPEVSIDDLQSAGLDYLFLSSEPFPFKQNHIDELSDLLPQTQIVLVDGEAFSWYGTRLLKIEGYFQSLKASLT